MMALPEWSSDDPLAALFGVWFGNFSLDADGRSRRAQFAEGAEVVNIRDSESLTSMVDALTPVDLTAMEIDYSGDSPGTGIVVVNPSEPTDLFKFWNLRAAGAQVMPWPIGYEDIVQPVIRRWIEWLLIQERIRNVGYVEGTTGPPRLNIWASENHGNVDQFPLLQDLLLAYDLAVSPGDDFVWGWRGRHPLTTEFSRSFDADVDARAEFVTISLPTLPWSYGRRSSRWPGIVAADVDFYSERGFDPELTTTVPRARRLSKLLTRSVFDYNSFQRPTGHGLVYGVQAAAETVQMALVHPLHVVEGLFDRADWKFFQSDDGRFATRLGQLFGGVDSTAANQPAVREVLLKAAIRDDLGAQFPVLQETARQFLGAWAGPLSRNSPDQYIRSVLLWLLERKLLRTVLPLTCPSCRSTFVVAPDDLATDLQCSFCDHRFPLALAVAWAGRKSDWRYRIAGHVPELRLKSALPVLAVTSAIAGLTMGETQLQIAGTKVSAPGREAEFDIAAVTDLFSPEVVLGEVKSHGAIDRNDLENLAWAQEQLRNKRVECFILIATLKDRLSPDEVRLLRKCCEQELGLLHLNGPNGPNGPIEPLLPIVLTNRQLSVDQFSDDHPYKWRDPGCSLSAVAAKSCKQNLGLIGIKPVHVNGHWTYECTWDD